MLYAASRRRTQKFGPRFDKSRAGLKKETAVVVPVRPAASYQAVAPDWKTADKTF